MSNGATESRVFADALQALLDEREQLRDEIARLRAGLDYLLSAVQRTLRENGHLADGDVCTLIVLKRAFETLSGVGAGYTAPPDADLNGGEAVRVTQKTGPARRPFTARNDGDLR